MMLRDGQLLEAESLSELGVYGTFIRRGDDVLLNRQAGHLVRTKVSPHCCIELLCSRNSRLGPCLLPSAIPMPQQSLAHCRLRLPMKAVWPQDLLCWTAHTWSQHRDLLVSLK